MILCIIRVSIFAFFVIGWWTISRSGCLR